MQVFTIYCIINTRAHKYIKEHAKTMNDFHSIHNLYYFGVHNCFIVFIIHSVMNFEIWSVVSCIFLKKRYLKALVI